MTFKVIWPTFRASHYFAPSGEPENVFPFWQRKNRWQKLLYWVHNFPGIEIQIGGVKILLLEWFEGHPWNRVYVNTPRWSLVLHPGSGGIQEWNGIEGWYGQRWRSWSLSPRNASSIEHVLGQLPGGRPTTEAAWQAWEKRWLEEERVKRAARRAQGWTPEFEVVEEEE